MITGERSVRDAAAWRAARRGAGRAGGMRRRSQHDRDHERRSVPAGLVRTVLWIALAACTPAAAWGDDPPAADAPTQAERMTERGFVRYRGAWRTRQEIELIERAERAEAAQREWAARLEKLRRRVDDPAAGAAAEELRSIRDPVAVSALAAALPREPVSAVRTCILEALAGIGTTESWGAVVQAAIDHPHPDTRLAAAELLASGPARQAEPVLVAALSGPDNARINRAAEAIATLRLEGAVPALVRALETDHVVTIGDGRPPGQTSVTFGNGGGDGLALGGGGPKRGTARVRNESVRAALERITGERLGGDAAAWRAWLSRRAAAEAVDLRRAAAPPAGAGAAGGPAKSRRGG